MDITSTINGLLNDLDLEFNPRLSTVIDIPQYSKKIVDNAKVVAYFEKGKLCAFIAFYCNDISSKIGYMSMLAVAIEKRGHGLAMNLINISIETLKKEKFLKYRLEVYKSNDKAISLYKKNNFIIIGETTSSYIMEMDINS